METAYAGPDVAGMHQAGSLAMFEDNKKVFVVGQSKEKETSRK